MEPPRKYPAGREPWTLAGVTKKTWLAQATRSADDACGAGRLPRPDARDGAGGDGSLQSEAEIVAAVSPCNEREPGSGGCPWRRLGRQGRGAEGQQATADGDEHACACGLAVCEGGAALTGAQSGARCGATQGPPRPPRVAHGGSERPVDAILRLKQAVQNKPHGAESEGFLEMRPSLAGLNHDNPDPDPTTI